MIDFEQAERKAAEAVFPQAAVLGCNFHFKQATNWPEINLKRGQFWTGVLYYLHFINLPAETNDTTGVLLTERSGIFNRVKPEVISYFERVWVGRYGS